MESNIVDYLSLFDSGFPKYKKEELDCIMNEFKELMKDYNISK